MPAISDRQKSPIAALLTKASSINVLVTGDIPRDIPRRGVSQNLNPGVSPYLIPPQSLAFINALLLNFFARPDFIDTLRWRVVPANYFLNSLGVISCLDHPLGLIYPITSFPVFSSHKKNSTYSNELQKNNIISNHLSDI